MKYITSLTLLCTLLSQTINATVIEGTNVVLSNVGFPDADYTLTVYQDASATDPTSIFFDVTDSKLSIIDYNIDEASDWFLVSLNDEFSAATINADSFSTLIQHTPSFKTNEIDTGFGDFYLGINTGNDDGVGFPPRNIYGWVELRNIGGNLTLLDSAITYSGDGIIVGTTQVIPEPSSTVLLLGMGTLSFVAARRNRK